MKKTYLSYGFILLLGITVIFTSCQKDFPKNVESTDEVVLKSIKIVNAGESGNGIIDGKVDEYSKTVSFPRLDTLTDFSQLKFQAEVSDGASLDQESYNIDFEPGQSEKTIVIKVVHNKRFREYLVNLRLLVPVFGADFSKYTAYDNSNNEAGNPTYPAFAGLTTRGSGFDGENVLIVTRADGGSRLIKVSDIRNGNDVSKPLTLNMTGVSGGTFPVNVGAQISGHTYISNLASTASPLKIYHWTDPSQAPELLGSFDLSQIEGAGARHGDNMSGDLDENGNGYFYFGDNAVSRILRIKVTNFTTLSEPKTFDNATGSSFIMSFRHVKGTENYLYTGYDAPIRVANADAVISYSLPNTAVPLNAVDAQVVNFNGERYLLLCTAPRYGGQSANLQVYDITKGENITEALQLFAERDNKSPLMDYSLGGGPNSAPGTQAGWSVSKDADGHDDVLTIYGASADAGFVVIDIPKKTLDD